MPVQVTPTELALLVLQLSVGVAPLVTVAALKLTEVTDAAGEDSAATNGLLVALAAVSVKVAPPVLPEAAAWHCHWPVTPVARLVGLPPSG